MFYQLKDLLSNIYTDSGFSENGIRATTGKTDPNTKLSVPEKILASALGGGLSAWNQPIEVVRVEMQSKKEDPNRPKKMTVANTAKYIYQSNGLKGLYRGEELRGDVERLMHATSLHMYADRLASKLSGGNQRKLSLAIALIGMMQLFASSGTCR